MLYAKRRTAEQEKKDKQLSQMTKASESKNLETFWEMGVCWVFFCCVPCLLGANVQSETGGGVRKEAHSQMTKAAESKSLGLKFRETGTAG